MPDERVGEIGSVLGSYRKKLLPRQKGRGLSLSQNSKTNLKGMTKEVLGDLAEKAIKNFRKRVLK